MANPKTPETDLLTAVKAVALFAADTDNYYLHEKERYE